MKSHPNIFTIKTLGAPVVAAGLLFFAGPIGTDASELGDKELKAGHESSEVESLQELLHERGLLDSENISGSFSDETVAAIESYQEDNGLDVDGIAGPNTVGALDILGENDDGALVENLQEHLSELGYYDSEPDGMFGSGTDDAVTEFQTSEEIAIDGLAGPETFGALMSALENADSEEAEASKSAEPKEQSEKPEESNEPTPDEAAVTTSAEADESQGESFQVDASAYTADCAGCSGVTATGVDLNANPDSNVIAVDPSVIPLGSTVEVEGHGTFTAADTGGAIQGNKIDIFMADQSEAESFGRQSVNVTVVD